MKVFQNRVFMTKVNPNNGNKAQSNIFSWDTFKCDIIFHWLQNTKLFQWLLYLAFNFIAKVRTNK